MSKEMITVIIEHRKGIITQHSLDAVNFALYLSAISGADAKAVILSSSGETAGKIASDLRIDADVLINSELEKYSAEAYTKVLSSYIKNSGSIYTLIPHTPQGYDYAPGLAYKLGLPCITAVTGLREYNDKAAFQRLTAGGRIESEVVSRCGKAVITVNPASGKIPKIRDASTPSINTKRVNLTLERTVEVLIKESEPRAGDLLRAPVVIAAGKGVASEENMSLLRDMARLFPGSSIAGSRGACDMGLTDYALQVGMTGKSISPRIYFACGISGSPQHMAGLRGAGTIVAINRDPDAPIHRMADISIVERIEDFIPEFLRAAKQ